MILFLEHNGTPDHNDLVQKMKNYLEDNYNVTCEEIIGDSHFVHFRLEDMKDVFHTDRLLSDSELDSILEMLSDED